MLLYKRQKKMKWLEGIALDVDVLDRIQKIPDFEKVFQNVRKLGLYPDTREVLEFCHMLVKNSPKVEKMTLHASFETSGVEDRELNDGSTGPGLITRTIFGHMQPFAKCTPLALKEITLQKIALRYAADTYCKIVDFRGVKGLKLFTCSGADALLAELSKSSKLPDKLETLVFKHEDNIEEDGLQALDGFLCLVSGIKNLTIDITNAKTLPAAAGIVRHAKTLEVLNVHANRAAEECDDEIIYDYAAFADICKHCKGLEQLSVGFPAVSVLNEKSPGFLNFEVCWVPLYGLDGEGYMFTDKINQHCISNLPRLITLNITTFPKTAPGLRHLPRKLYEALLQHLATQMFDFQTNPITSPNPPNSADTTAPHPRTSKLILIAWGASDKVYDRENSENQIIFAKGRQMGALGEENATAIQISWCLKRFTDVGKRGNVLDFALSRTRRMPVRSVAGSEESD